MLKKGEDDGRGDGEKDVNGVLLPELEERLWVPKGKNQLNGEDIDKFLIISRSVGTFARALDCSSSVKQPRYYQKIYFSKSVAVVDLLFAVCLQFAYECCRSFTRRNFIPCPQLAP